MKYLLSASLMVLITVTSIAQNKPADSTLVFSAAFNAEQMLEKMGFDNLMKAMFDNKKQDAKNTPEAVAKKATIRKALAAIYGAGINFNKKVWVISKQKVNMTGAVARLGYSDYESPLVLVSIPIANRQVMQENIVKLSAAEGKSDAPVKFTTTGDVVWTHSGKSVTLLTNTEMIIATLPKKIYDYNNDLYYGTTIKSDTVITPKTKTWADDESIEVTEKPVVIEIDKIVAGGKIKRVFVHKEKKDNSYAAPKVEELALDSAAAVVDTTVVITTDSVVVAAPAEDIATATKDTLTRGEYLNDSTYITHYYVPYTDVEKDSLQKIYDQQKEIKMQQQALEFVQQYQTYLPQQSSAWVQQLNADTADIVFYLAFGTTSPYSFLSSRMLGAGSMSGLLTNQPASVTSINFTNGMVTMSSTYSNTADSVKDLFNKLYKPITNFWPAQLGNPTLGSMQCNMDVQQLFSYIKNAAGPFVKFEKEMKKEGIDMSELQQAFTGQVAAAIHAGVNKRGKKQPRLFIALQLNNAAAAVNFMNRMGSKKTRFTNSYRFDENAQYLLFDTDGKNALLKQVVPLQKMPTQAPGTVAAANFNIKAMMQALTKDSKKTSNDYKQAQQFFSSINITAATSSTGNFTTVFSAGMGNSKTNALYNLMQLISSNGNGGGFPPLGRLMR